MLLSIVFADKWVEKFGDPGNLIPVLVAGIAYFFQAWLRMRTKRCLQSRIAAMILGEIHEEVRSGVHLLRYWYEHGGAPKTYGDWVPSMTTESWRGFNEIIPSEIYERIIAVTCRSGDNGVCMLRSHLKNYYVCICGHYDKCAVRKERVFNAGYYLNDIQGAEMVLGLVEKCRGMMERNSKRFWWPR